VINNNRGECHPYKHFGFHFLCHTIRHNAIEKLIKTAITNHRNQTYAVSWVRVGVTAGRVTHWKKGCLSRSSYHHYNPSTCWAVKSVNVSTWVRGTSSRLTKPAIGETQYKVLNVAY
jgi:hypothetical protein